MDHSQTLSNYLIGQAFNDYYQKFFESGSPISPADVGQIILDSYNHRHVMKSLTQLSGQPKAATESRISKLVTKYSPNYKTHLPLKDVDRSLQQIYSVDRKLTRGLNNLINQVLQTAEKKGKITQTDLDQVFNSTGPSLQSDKEIQLNGELEKVSQQLAHLEQKIDNRDLKLERKDQKISELKDIIDKIREEHNSREEQLKTRQAHLEDKLDKIQTKLQEKKTKITDRNNEIADLKTEIAGLKTKITDRNNEIAGLKTEIADLKTETTDLKNETTDLKTEIKTQENWDHQNLDCISEILDLLDQF